MLFSRLWACAGVVCAFALATEPGNSTHPQIQKLIDGDHWKRARALASSLVAANPRDAVALTYLSIIEESFNHWDAAKSYAEQAVIANDHYADGHAQLARVNAELAENANVFRQVNYVRVMKRELDAAYRIDSNNLDALLTEMMFTFKAPGIIGGSKAKAHEIARKILRAHPDWGHLAEAKLAQNENNEPSAIRWLREAGTSNYRIQSNLAQVFCCLSSHPRYEEAIHIAESMLRVDPTRVDAYVLLARSYAATGAMAELEQVLAQAAQRLPDDLAPYYWAARTLEEQKRDPARAEAYLKKYLSQEPEGRGPTAGEAHWTLALVLEQSGRKQEAAGEIKTAFRLRPDLEPLKRDYKRFTD